MALTRTRVRQLQAEELHRVSLGAGARPRSWAAWVTEARTVPAWVAGALALAWVATLQLVSALEPAPARHGPTPIWGVAFEIVMIAALTATAAGLVGRQRLGLLASMGAVGVALFGVVMCPVSGHHVSVGAWWYGQLAALGTLGGASLGGLRLTRGAHGSKPTS
jgi:hypothetical protein